MTSSARRTEPGPAYDQAIDRRTLLALLAGVGGAVFTPWAASGNMGRQPLGYLRTNWSADPFALGSYSFVARGSDRRDHAALQKPLGRQVFFAGEAAHPMRNSSVHAALESGWMAGESVLGTSARHVVVLGAGVSGLAAAQQLAVAGREVTVLEARERIGGRIRTDRSFGVPLDLGASWLHGDHGNPLTAIVQDLGMETVETDESSITRGAGGKDLGDGPAWLDRVTTIEHDAGADTAELNLEAYADEDEYPGRELVFPDGYDQILEAFKGDYRLLLSTTVTTIEHHNAGVRVGLKAGQWVDCDAVVVTLPLGLLKAGTVHFDPPLPGWKRQAIHRLGFGVLDKVYMFYDHVFWGDEQWIATPENGLPRGQFNEWLNLSRSIDIPVIMAFNAGTAARDLARMPDEDVVQRGVQALDSAYPY